MRGCSAGKIVNMLRSKFRGYSGGADRTYNGLSKAESIELEYVHVSRVKKAGKIMQIQYI
jgi:hypothetical protein